MENTNRSDIIIKGMKLAADKFLNERAAQNGIIIISDKDGVVKHVPAREILERRKQNKE